MKQLLGTSLLGAALSAGSATSKEHQATAAARTGTVRAVRVEGTVNAPVAEVWRVWTTSEGAEEFFRGPRG